jgi:hypothetical protein
MSGWAGIFCDRACILGEGPVAHPHRGHHRQVVQGGGTTRERPLAQVLAEDVEPVEPGRDLPRDHRVPLHEGDRPMSGWAGIFCDRACILGEFVKRYSMISR